MREFIIMVAMIFLIINGFILVFAMTGPTPEDIIKCEATTDMTAERCAFEMSR